MGSCWHIKLWGLENCAKALFVNGSCQRNMTHQQDSNFVCFYHLELLCTQLDHHQGFKICFPLVGMSLTHIFTLTANVLTILVDFLT